MENAKRSQADLEAIGALATQRDTLQLQVALQKETGMWIEDLDPYGPILVAYLIDKKENGSSSIDKWMDVPFSEISKFLNIDEDEVEPDPKELTTE